MKVLPDTALPDNVLIVTRNKNDYRTSDIPCMSPADFLAFFNAAETPGEDR
jgi:hypothetical protein